MTFDLRHTGTLGEDLPGISDIATIATAGFDADALCDFAAKVGPFWKTARDDAGAAGTSAHAYIAWLLGKGDVPRVRGTQDGAAVINWGRWAMGQRLHEAKALFVEDLLIDTARGVGGTPDAILDIPGRGIVLLDWKSSTRILAKHVVQVCAYARAAQEEWGLVIVEAVAIRIPRTLAEWPSETSVRVGSAEYQAALDVFDAGLAIFRRRHAIASMLRATRAVKPEQELVR